MTHMICRIGLIAVLAGCGGPVRNATDRAAASDDLNISGKPYVGPPGPVSSMPPGDNSMNRLRCHPEGQGTECTRTD